MKKRAVQALGCLLVMTMMAGSLTACGGKTETETETKTETKADKKNSDVKVAIICSAQDRMIMDITSLL